jgi:hypothetical protein
MPLGRCSDFVSETGKRARAGPSQGPVFSFFKEKRLFPDYFAFSA